MEILAAFVMLIAFTTGIFPQQSSPKNQVSIPMGGPGSVTIRAAVDPLTVIDAARTVKQHYDFSCGSAALATLLDYNMGEHFTEKQVIQGLLTYGDSREIARRRAFSLLDMKRFVAALGYQGAGYKAEISDLRTLGQPGIVPIKLFGYRHFTVFKGIYRGHVFLADPWRGNISFTIPEFKKIWFEHALFLVTLKGAPVHNGLRLTDQDLRFIDEDQALQIINSRDNVSEFVENLQIQNQRQDKVTYKP